MTRCKERHPSLGQCELEEGHQGLHYINYGYCPRGKTGVQRWATRYRIADTVQYMGHKWLVTDVTEHYLERLLDEVGRPGGKPVWRVIDPILKLRREDPHPLSADPRLPSAVRVIYTGAYSSLVSRHEGES